MLKFIPNMEIVLFISSPSTGCLLLFFRYIVKKDAPGLTATKIENKIGLRIVQNGDIIMKKVFVPDSDRLPGVNSFQDTNKVRFFNIKKKKLIIFLPSKISWSNMQPAMDALL